MHLLTARKGNLRLFAISIALAALAAIAISPAGASAGSGDTVTISGTVYAFFGIDDHIPGSVVRVDEYPGISSAVAPDGSYAIEVPDDANVTPYIDTPAGYQRTYLQTFHTSGQDLKHVHFQVTPTSIYQAFAALLSVPVDDSGQIEQCAIVSTFSIHEARDATTFDPGFKDVYPHGLPGSTATMDPVLGDTRGPIYFDEAIFPDPTETSSSVDGGVVWVEVPAGYYWLEPDHPTSRLAPFLAHCEDGRLINASPPWGFYELKAGEEPDPAVLASAPDESLDGTATAKETQQQKGDEIVVAAKVKADEDLSVEATGRIELRGKAYELKPGEGSVAAGGKATFELKPRRAKHEKKIVKALKRGRKAEARVKVKLSDGAGNTATERLSVALKR
jgi:hypothetical protein